MLHRASLPGSVVIFTGRWGHSLACGKCEEGFISLGNFGCSFLLTFARALYLLDCTSDSQMRRIFLMEGLLL